MANIEERAKELYPDAFDDDEIVPAREGYIVKVQRLAYIEGATAQKKIDDEENGKALLYAVHKTEERTKREMIEKACKLMNEFFAEGGTVDDWVRDNPSLFCGEKWFREKMEG